MPKTKPIQIRVTEDDLAAIKAAAELERTSISRFMLISALERIRQLQEIQKESA